MTDDFNLAPWPTEALAKRPGSVHELIERLMWLEQRVHLLETQLSKYNLTDFASLQKVEYHIGKLYVKDLSGTLNIGITAIGEDKTVTDLTRLESDELDDEDALFESPSDRTWVRDSEAVWTDEESD